MRNVVYNFKQMNVPGEEMLALQPRFPYRWTQEKGAVIKPLQDDSIVEKYFQESWERKDTQDDYKKNVQFLP